MVAEDNDNVMDDLGSYGLRPLLKQWPSMVLIKDHNNNSPNGNNHHFIISNINVNTPESNDDTHQKDDDVDDDGLTIFPPSSHENLIPSQFDLLHPKEHPPLPSPPPASPSDSDPPPSSPVTRWCGLALQIFRAKVAGIGSRFPRGAGGGGKLLAVVAAVAAWWLWVRVRRWWRRRESVRHLLLIIKEKDEKIIKLLNQITQLNEALVARHKVLASKLAD